MPASSEDKQSDLIGSIYECALDPAAWTPTLQAICEAVNGLSAGIVVLDYAGRGDRLVHDWGPAQGWGNRFAEVAGSVKRIHRQFLGIQDERASEPILLPQDLADAEQVFATPFYRQWAAPQGIHQVLEAIALSEPTRLGLFCITRHVETGRFSEQQIRLVRRLAPHIRRVITISDLLDLRAVERDAFAATIDSLSTAVCIVSASSLIVHANLKARELIVAQTPIRVESGYLRANWAGASQQLAEAITRAARRPGMVEGAGLGVRLSSPDRSGVIAYVLPLAPTAAPAGLVPEPLVAVFVRTSEPPGFENLDAIGRCFGFTPAETRVVEALSSGRTLAETAEMLGIGTTTAKSHLHSVFTKSNVSRQADLLALIERLTPMARRGAG